MDADELVLIPDSRERTEHGRVDEAERGGIGSDPDGEAQHHAEGESRGFQQAAERITQVLIDRVEDAGARSGCPACLGDAARRERVGE